MALSCLSHRLVILLLLKVLLLILIVKAKLIAWMSIRVGRIALRLILSVVQVLVAVVVVVVGVTAHLIVLSGLAT